MSDLWAKSLPVTLVFRPQGLPSILRHNEKDRGPSLQAGD